MTEALMEKVAQVRPDVWDFLAKTRDEVAMSPFRDEILGEMDYAIKTAEGMHPLANYGAGIAAGIGTAIAYSLGGDLYEAARRGITKGRNYKAMLKANPQLAELDPHKVRTTFDTLHRFNPDFASDPYVAGSYVQRNALLEGGYSDTKELESMIGARKNLHDIRKLPVPNQIPRWDNESNLDKQLKSKQLGMADTQKELADQQLSKLRHENTPEVRGAQAAKLQSEIEKNRQPVRGPNNEVSMRDVKELEALLHGGQTQQSAMFRQWKRDLPPVQYIQAMKEMAKSVKAR